MVSKILLTLSPLLSVLAPVCSTSAPVELSVFASMMSGNPYRPDNSPSAGKEGLDPETLKFDETLRAMSFNVHSDDDPKHAWNERMPRVASTIRFHKADVVGVQEPSQRQLDDLRKSLPEFQVFAGASLIEGRVHDPIFFRKSRFELLESGHFFLSPTPDEPSKGWDSKFPRATSWVKLLDKKRNVEFYFFNTHFDYHGRQARDESAHLLRQKVFTIAKSNPFVITGDFNLFPKLGGAETYKILTDKTSPAPFIDAHASALFPHHGPTGTWSGFQEAGQAGIKPDYIFVSSLIDVYLHGVLADSFDGHFPSDHLPVLADIVIK